LYFSTPPYVPRIVDTQTGATSGCSVPGAANLDFLGCSPWRDGNGQHHMAALYLGGGADRPLYPAGPIELRRYTFPGGRVLGRTIIDPLPRWAICWAPDRSDRIVFAAGDGRLYRHDFAEGHAGLGECEVAEPPPVRWHGKRRRDGGPWLQDPCWPDDPALGRRMLVALRPPQEDREKPLPRLRLWWVRLDSEVRNIIETSRAMIPDDVAPDVEERRPSVGKAHDGTLVVAYLARDPAHPRWDLWVAPIAVEPSGGGPRVLAPRRRRLANECAPALVAFSPDGHWIFAAVHDARSGVRTHRFRVPTFSGAEPGGSGGNTSCGSPGRHFIPQGRATADSDRCG
jgi:hypothetical protein